MNHCTAAPRFTKLENPNSAAAAAAAVAASFCHVSPLNGP
jgi:hypothetical protein